MKDPAKQQLCESCAGIQQNWRKAKGHPELMQGTNRTVAHKHGSGHHHQIPLRALRHRVGVREQQGQPPRGLVGGGAIHPLEVTNRAFLLFI
jgi:hypothetical protein